MSNCPTCGGLGVVCIDDMCRGIGECIHGDGACPTCFGDPDNLPDDPDDMYPVDESVALAAIDHAQDGDAS
jgi:hypothetical protein